MSLGLAVSLWRAAREGPSRAPGWTITNDTANRSFDANVILADEIADALATLIRDLAATGVIGDVA